MNFKKLTALLVIFVVLITSTSLIAQETNLPEIATGKDIRERLGNPDINLLDTGEIIFKNDKGEVIAKPDLNSKLQVNFDWSLENKEAILVEAGDYFTFKLPETFRINYDFTGPLGEYGNFFVDANGYVTIVFNKNVCDSSNVHGYVNFEVKLNEEVIGQPGHKEILLPVKDASNIEFDLVPKVIDRSIEKNGTIDRDLNPESASWDVVINKGYETLPNVVVTDYLPEELELEEIIVYPVQLDNDGNYQKDISYGEPLSKDAYSTDGAIVSFNDTINSPYAIRFVTKIKEESKLSKGGTLTLTNNAMMTYEGGEEYPASDTIHAIFGRKLEKLAPKYNANEQSFVWNVKYNYGAEVLTNPLLTDTFDDRLVYEEGSIRIKNKENQPVSYDYTVVNSPSNVLDIQFNENVEEPIIIEYKTKVKEGVLITENQEFTNTITDGDETDGNKGTARANMIVKDHTAIDYNKKTMDWKVTFNLNQYELNNYEIVDTFTNLGLTLREDTLKVIDKTHGNTLVLDTDYTLTNSTEEGFVLKFINEYEPTSSKLEITYTTDYDVIKLNANSTNVFKNKAELNWEDTDGNKHNHSDDAQKDVNSSTVNNGHKFGTYNAIDKEITWVININYDQHTLKNASVKDVIPVDQKYVPESLVIRTYTLEKNGNVTYGDVLDLSLFNIQEPELNNDYTLNIEILEESNKQYSIQFKTDVTSKSIKRTYNNVAEFRNDGESVDLPGSLTIENGNKFVSKSGVQNGALIDWTIAINQSQSTLKEASIKDTSSSNQLFIKDSFRLYPVIMEASGNYQLDMDNPLILDEDYSITFTHSDEGQTFVLDFTKEVTQTYVLKYSSQINASYDDLTVTNSVVLNGNSVEYEDTNGNTAVVVDVNQAGGGAVGVKGSLVLVKEDPEGNPLEGVEFEIFNPLQRSLGIFVTDKDGRIEFSGLVYGEYTLKETQALEGYVISRDLILGKEVEVDAITSRAENILRIENRMNELVINKKNTQDELIDGAVFTLEKKVNSEYVNVKEEVAVSEGSIVLKGLESGEYRLVETSPATGYMLNTEPTEFEILRDDLGQEIDTIVNIINYRGSVELTKLDENKNVLEGVVFNLFNDQDVLVRENLTTNGLGKITLENELSPGNYYFKEVSSVEGNVVNEEPISFSVISSFEGEPTKIQLTATNSKASVDMRKLDKTGKALPGVEFTVFAKDIDEPYAVVVSEDNGYVHIDQLQPGTYYLVESKALPGYILNTELREFTIPEKSLVDKVEIILDDFVNYTGGFKVEKVDSYGNLLKEATFMLKDESGVRIAEKTTENGVLEFEDLDPGKYILSETQAPQGYKLETKEFEVSISSEYEGEYVYEAIQIVNEALPQVPNEPLVPSNPRNDIPNTPQVTLPNTGVSNSGVHASMVLVALGTTMLLYGMRRKEKN